MLRIWYLLRAYTVVPYDLERFGCCCLYDLFIRVPVRTDGRSPRRRSTFMTCPRMYRSQER